jgi:hypothetical protein
VSNLHHAVHAGQSSPIGPRPEVAPEPPEPPPPGRRLGYSYDPIPSAIRSDRRLKPIDHIVLAILLSFAVWRRDSCWTTIATIARRLPALRTGPSGSIFASDRTVQRSIQRLINAQIIRRDQVPKPDLDDPRNMTGYRYYFLFVPIQATDDQPLPSRASDVQDPVAPPSPVQQAAGEIVEDGPVRTPTEEPSAGGTAEGATEPTEPAIQPTITPLPGDHPEAEGSGSQVTSKSPDSLVTQDRGETRKPDKTFNVANANGSALATTGEENRSAKVEGIMNRTDATTGDQRPPARIPLASVWTPAELAAKLVARIRAGGINLKVEQDPVQGETIRSYRMTPSYGEISEADQDELRRLRTHVLAYLKGPVDPVSSTTDKPGSSTAGKPAPAVPGRVQAEVRNLIGQLPGNTDPAIEATVCRAISEALGDRKPQSLETFLGLAGDVRRGGLAVGCLQDAFEAGCSRTARNRGAMFTKGLKDSIRISRRIGDRRAAGGTP